MLEIRQERSEIGMVKFLDLQMQYKSLRPEMDDAITAVIENAAFIGGQRVASFEEQFSEFVGVPYCVGVGNGTDALELALEALDLPHGSEVIVPANTFIASSEAVTRVGHRVVFCDCDPEDYTINIDSLEASISEKTAAIMAVHLYGHPCNMEEILRVADQYGLKIIEDCAQAHGARYKGAHVGSFGDVSAFSFYPGKNLGAYGDAGAVVTSDQNLAKQVRMIANHGRIAKYDHEFEGRNSRMDGLQAAVLQVKLPHLSEWVARRQHVADLYRELLTGCDSVTLPVVRPDVEHAYHLYVIRTEARDELRQHLTKTGIETGIHYPISLPRLKAYDYLGLASADLVANHFCDKLLSLPMGEHLSEDDIAYVANSIRTFFES